MHTRKGNIKVLRETLCWTTDIRLAVDYLFYWRTFTGPLLTKKVRFDIDLFCQFDATLNGKCHIFLLSGFTKCLLCQQVQIASLNSIPHWDHKNFSSQMIFNMCMHKQYIAKNGRTDREVCNVLQTGNEIQRGKNKNKNKPPCQAKLLWRRCRHQMCLGSQTSTGALRVLITPLDKLHSTQFLTLPSNIQ